MVLHLTINNSSSSNVTLTACDSLTWHDSTFTASTSNYQLSTTNSYGCDSTVTLHLTINHGTYTSVSQESCDSVQWHGQSYNATGSYLHSYTNAEGCSSVDTLHLVIHDTYRLEAFDTACDSYRWNGNTYTESTVTPYYTMQSVHGCDSSVSLHLVVHYSVRDTLVATARDSYNWNGTTYTESGEYTFQGTTSEGCDSIVLLVLTIIPEQGVDPVAGLDDIIVYPNPTAGYITISSDEVLKVEIYDFLGRTAAVHTATNRIDLSSLPSGSYTLRISLPQGSTIRRVIKK